MRLLNGCLKPSVLTCAFWCHSRCGCCLFTFRQCLSPWICKFSYSVRELKWQTLLCLVRDIMTFSFIFLILHLVSSISLHATFRSGQYSALCLGSPLVSQSYNYPVREWRSASSWYLEVHPQAHEHVTSWASIPELLRSQALPWWQWSPWLLANVHFQCNLIMTMIGCSVTFPDPSGSTIQFHSQHPISAWGAKVSVEVATKKCSFSLIFCVCADFFFGQFCCPFKILLFSWLWGKEKNCNSSKPLLFQNKTSFQHF